MVYTYIPYVHTYVHGEGWKRKEGTNGMYVCMYVECLLSMLLLSVLTTYLPTTHTSKAQYICMYVGIACSFPSLHSPTYLHTRYPSTIILTPLHTYTPPTDTHFFLSLYYDTYGMYVCMYVRPYY